MASAGLPLVTSDVCGASTRFLKKSYNGYLFKSGDHDDLKKKILAMMQLDEEERKQMCERSNQLAHQITPAIWANNIMSVLER